MRRILINQNLENKAKDFCNNLFKNKNSNFVQPKDGLQILYNKLRPQKHRIHREYIKNIITNYDDIIKAKPNEIKGFIKKFRKIDSGKILNEHVLSKKIKFHESIVNAMRYDALRDKEFNSYLVASGIKACVYCNFQSTVVIESKYYNSKTQKKIKEKKAKLELDHFYAKSKYPFLCTSFYNLYPVCGNCNRAKSYNNIDFVLYTTNPNDIDIFHFKIDDDSVLDYWLSTNKDDLKIDFIHLKGNNFFLNEYNKMFSIQGIYDTQKDIAEELVHKAKVYSPAYKSDLVDNFKSLFPDKTIINRLLIGNYDKAEDLHKRTMAKYMQDLATDLKLI